MYYYDVYVENSKNIYTYKSTEQYDIGEWCIINFINSNRMGLIIEKKDVNKLGIELSKIKYIIDRAPILSIPKEIVELIKWIKNYYVSDYYNVIKTVYPGILKLNYSKKAIYIKDLEDKNRKSLIDEINKNDELMSFNEYMKKKKEVTIQTLHKNFSKELVERAEKEKAIIVEKKLILKQKKIENEKIETKIAKEDVILNEEQKNTVNEIKNRDKKVFLLKGVTGSGKTEIYIHLIKESLKNGKGSIFLVPEISLTTQMIERLKKEFLGTVAILHSKLTESEKKEEWNYIRAGEKKIVIGARSAIFAPVQNLQYIIIDEEHENSYKQDNNPRYHVKNVAIKRALLEKNCKVVLGSATPSFESYYQGKIGDIELLELKTRYNNAKIPKYEIIDLNEVDGNFSKKLLDNIAKKLEKKEQILLILNRKAYSYLLKCKECGEIPTCPHCSISLSYYKSNNKLKCNYCGYEKKYVKKCHSCGSERLIELGSGTEKIEQELREYFPSANIIRVDSESVKTKEDYENIYNDFKNHKYDIMLGTQIIAKGFHFPNVTLVGIINADVILHFPDFRASEKTFQLLVQSGGRAGRGEKEGEVLIQTLNVENNVITNVIENNYENYFKEEMKIRKALNYSPYGKMITIILSSKNEENLYKKVLIYYEMIKYKLEKILNSNKGESLIKPIEAPIYKINGRYRYKITIKFNRENNNKIKKIIAEKTNEYKEKDVRISIDVDPINMM